MLFQWKVFAVKLILLVILGPIVALVMVKFADMAQEAWRTNNRKKKMDSHVLCCRNNRWISRFSPIILFVFLWPRFVLGQAEDEAFPKMINEIITDSEMGNANLLARQFDQLQMTFSQTEDPLIQARLFLDSFIFEMNARYNVALELEQVCGFIKEHIDVFAISIEDSSQLLMLIDLLLNGSISIQSKFYWPSEWNWFGLNKNEKDQKTEVVQPSLRSSFLPPVLQTAYPPILDSGVIVGGLEVIAGTSITFVFSETVIGPLIGGCMIYDGINRISNKGQEDIESFLRDRSPTEIPPE